MTRVCIRCTRIIGEKCVRCGAEATPLNVNSSGHAVPGTEFDCSTCGHHFTQGEGGETGGMCERCLDSSLRQDDRIGSEKPNMRGEANDNQQR
jgi:DNA-directed RNA polymerase subunit RPC12/RpoP